MIYGEYSPLCLSLSSFFFFGQTRKPSYSLGLGCMRYYSVILEDLAFKHSLRIYCIDRPGVGMSHTVEPEVSKKANLSSVHVRDISLE